MKQATDNKTMELPMPGAKRGRGRPVTGTAMTNAERQKAHRDRKRALKVAQGVERLADWPFPETAEESRLHDAGLPWRHLRAGRQVEAVPSEGSPDWSWYRECVVLHDTVKSLEDSIKAQQAEIALLIEERARAFHEVEILNGLCKRYEAKLNPKPKKRNA